MSHTWLESSAATCYGPVTVVAQWTAEGHIRLIQLTDNRKGIGWKGKVWPQPTDTRWGNYWANVFNLIAHSEPRIATIGEVIK